MTKSDYLKVEEAGHLLQSNGLLILRHKNRFRNAAKCNTTGTMIVTDLDDKSGKYVNYRIYLKGNITTNRETGNWSINPREVTWIPPVKFKTYTKHGYYSKTAKYFPKGDYMAMAEYLVNFIKKNRR